MEKYLIPAYLVVYGILKIYLHYKNKNDGT
jgi:hypothetical protein